MGARTSAWSWILSSFEGTDGTADGKKLSMFFFTMLSAFMVITQGALEYVYPEVAWWTIVGGAVGSGFSDIPGRLMNSSKGADRTINRRRG